MFFHALLASVWFSCVPTRCQRKIMSKTVPIELLVCTSCRAGRAEPEDEKRQGTLLFEAIKQETLPENVKLTAVACLANCDHGCSIVLRGKNRWTYVYGNLDPRQHVGTILDGASRYLDAVDGRVPWRERPEHFRKNCIARIPPIEAAS